MTPQVSDGPGQGPANVIGRDSELATVDAALEGIEEGPVALVITGEAGIGKTTVWQEAIRRATSRSCRVLRCSPTASEAKLAYAALADLLSTIEDGILEELPAPQRHALAVALLREEPGRSPPDQRAVSAGFLCVLDSLAAGGPVLLAIDDVQWMDAPSAHVVEFAIRRLSGQRVGLLLSARKPEQRAFPLGVDRSLPAERVHRVEVGPLTLGALHHLLVQWLDVAFPRPALVRLEAASGGNPFFALEIARSLVASGLEHAGARELPMPENLLELVQDRIAKLPAAARQALLIASAAARPTLELIEAVADERTLAALARAEAAGVVEVDGEVRFTHPLLASAVYSSAPRVRRLALHRRLAEAVTDPEERARHLALGTDRPDPTAASVLEDAARRAYLRGAPDAAADLSEHAIRLTPRGEAEERTRRTTEAAGYLFAAGDASRARIMLEDLVAAALAGPGRAAALMLLGEIRIHDEGAPAAIGVLSQALAEVDGDQALRAQIERDLAVCRTLSGDVNGAEPHARSALELAERIGDLGLIAECLAAMAAIDFLLGRDVDEEQVRRALELEDPDRRVPVILRPTLLVAILRLGLRRLSEARALLEGLREQLIERGEQSSLPFFEYQLVAAALFLGDLDAALRYAEESHEHAVQIGHEAMRGFALDSLARVHGLTGDVELARAEAEEALEILQRTGWGTAVAWSVTTLANRDMSLGDAASAIGRLEPLLRIVEATGLEEPARWPFLPTAIDALVGVGDLDRAEALSRRLRERALERGRPHEAAQGSRGLGLVLAARGDLDGALAAFDEALAKEEGGEGALLRPRILLAKGMTHRRRKEKRVARETLESALTLFEEIGARVWADDTRRELGRVGRPPAAPLELTATEERVAELAASGMTSKEVAARVFLSPKTVEANLARIYRKLGIKSRAELGSKMAERAGSA